MSPNSREEALAAGSIKYVGVCKKGHGETEFYTQKNGRCGRCISCERARGDKRPTKTDRGIRKANRDSRAAAIASGELKYVGICGSHGEAQFHTQAYADAGLCVTCKTNREKARDAANPEAKKARGKAYRKANAEKIKAKDALYREANRDDFREYHNRYEKERRANDPFHKVASNLRRRVREVLQRYGTKKTGKTFELIGCTPDELYDHLEDQFQDGMSWENRSEWHIDHIRPCASFDLTDPAQQRECWHYTNLQPLWASENCSKGAKDPFLWGQLKYGLPSSDSIGLTHGYA